MPCYRVMRHIRSFTPDQLTPKEWVVWGFLCCQKKKPIYVENVVHLVESLPQDREFPPSSNSRAKVDCDPSSLAGFLSGF
jgi:hypothetical protein